MFCFSAYNWTNIHTTINYAKEIELVKQSWLEDHVSVERFWINFGRARWLKVHECDQTLSDDLFICQGLREYAKQMKKQFSLPNFSQRQFRLSCQLESIFCSILSCAGWSVRAARNPSLEVRGRWYECAPAVCLIIHATGAGTMHVESILDLHSGVLSDLSSIFNLPLLNRRCGWQAKIVTSRANLPEENG